MSALGQRYGHTLRFSEYGLTTHDLGNNETRVTGITKVDSSWMALTNVESKSFKTLAGARRWLARRGYDAHGRRIR